MRKKKVWRYYCDFCKKANCSAPSIRKHEKGCTMNPSRVCGMCGMFDLEQPSLNKMMAFLPDPEKYKETSDAYDWISYTSAFSVKVTEALPKLRDEAENCPACILAALRQKGVPVPVAREFQFTDECAAWWHEFNRQQHAQEVF